MQATALSQTIYSTNKLRSPTLKFDILLFVTSVEDFGVTSKGRRKQSENPQLKGKDVMLVIVFVVCSLITSLAWRENKAQLMRFQNNPVFDRVVFSSTLLELTIFSFVSILFLLASWTLKYLNNYRNIVNLFKIKGFTLVVSWNALDDGHFHSNIFYLLCPIQILQAYRHFW